jgi:hypothetical protein
MQYTYLVRRDQIDEVVVVEVADAELDIIVDIAGVKSASYSCLFLKELGSNLQG